MSYFNSAYNYEVIKKIRSKEKKTVHNGSDIIRDRKDVKTTSEKNHTTPPPVKNTLMIKHPHTHTHIYIYIR